MGILQQTGVMASTVEGGMVRVYHTADLCVHTGLNSPTIDAHIVLRERQREPSCNMDHLPHQINAGNAFGDGVLHLAIVAMD